MYIVEFQRFFMQLRLFAGTLVLPGANVAEVDIVTLRFTGILIFRAEMTAAGLVAVQGVTAEQFTELKEVGGTAGIFQLLVEFGAAAGNLDVFPELFAEGRNLFEAC